MYTVSYYTKINSTGIATNAYLQAAGEGTLDSNSVTWTDPTNDMIAVAHELTLRTVIATTTTVVHTLYNDVAFRANAPDLLTQDQPEIESPNLTLVNRTLDQDAEVYMTFSETIYRVQPGWLAGAFAVIGIACASIIPTYWGWWRLGRSVSLSPLEIAKAFDAPLMEHARPNGTADDHLRVVGGMRVRYGFYAPLAQQPQPVIQNDESGRQSLQFETSSASSGQIVGHLQDDGVESVFQDINASQEMPVADRTQSDDAPELRSLRFWTESTPRSTFEHGRQPARSFLF